MRDFIVNKTPWFLLAWLGAVALGTGLGALAISRGVPPMVVVYTELALQLTLTLAVAVGVPERLGGLVAAALTMVLPLGAFVAWAEVTLSRATTSATAVLGLGAALLCLAGSRALAPRAFAASSVPARQS
jgi:hypothetical protein